MQNAIDDFITELISKYHLNRLTENNPFICGDYYAINYPECSGNCWIYQANEDIAMVLMDFLLGCKMTISFENTAYTYISYYREIEGIFSLNGREEKLSCDTVYTNNGALKNGKTVFMEGSTLKGMAILLSPKNWLHCMYGKSEECIIRKLSNVNGTYFFQKISAILSQIENCPVQSKKMAELYYASKLNEMMAVIIDCADDKCSNCMDKNKISSDDRKDILMLAEYIRNNPAQELDTDKLAGMVHMSRAKLYYTFKNVVNMSVLEYRNEMRGEQAKNMLKNTNDSIGNIARMLGFSSSSTFSRFFKERYNITPKDFRQDVRKFDEN